MKQTQSIGLSSLVDSIYSSRNAFGAFKINLFWFLFQYSSNSFSMQSIYCFVLKTRRLKLQYLYFLYFSATKIRIIIHFSKITTYYFEYLTYISSNGQNKNFTASLDNSLLVYRLEKATPNDGHCLSYIITKRNFISHSVAYTPVRQEYSYMQDG